MTSKLIFIIVFCFASFSFSQNQCACEKNKLRGERVLLHQKDSVEIFKVINVLKNDNKKICIYKGLEIEFEYYLIENRLNNALVVLKEQEKLLRNNNCNDKYIFEKNYNKALYYQNINDFEKSSEYAFKSLKEAEKLKSSEKEIEAIKTIVKVFTRMDEDDKNWAYIKRAEKLILKQKPSVQSIKNYIWLGFEYEKKYTTTNRKTLLDSLFIFAEASRKVGKKYLLNKELAKSYRMLEAYSYHKGDAKKALYYIDLAINHAKKYFTEKKTKKRNIGGLYISKSWDYLDLKDSSKAIKWMDSALFYDIHNKKTAAGMMMYLDASDLYKQAGNIDKSYASFKTYVKLKDSILNIKRIRNINELETKYKTALKDAEITALNQQQKIDALEILTKQNQIKWLMLILVFSVLIMVTILFIYRQRTARNKIKIMQTEQRLNRARINPHFFFNAMASLQGLSYKEDSPKTALFISRFAKIMRQSLESTYEDMVTIDNEIDFLTQYLEIQKSRFPEKFDFNFSTDATLETEELKIPSMILQPFVENSIEHGFKNINYKGNITITFDEKLTNIEISIIDNGEGVSRIEKHKNYPSRAMQIIKDRLILFNKQYKVNAQYQLLKPEMKKGFKIIVTLPKIYA